MKVYRYEITTPVGTQGFLTAIDDCFESEDIILRLTWLFEQKLPAPTCDMKGTVSYFTAKGNRAFRKAIRQVKSAAVSAGFPFTRIVADIPRDTDEVIYEDKYQIIIKVKESV